jgi:ABC-type Fe3+-hydroxamate transport system substrate-binding protein
VNLPLSFVGLFLLFNVSACTPAANDAVAKASASASALATQASELAGTAQDTYTEASSVAGQAKDVAVGTAQALTIAVTKLGDKVIELTSSDADKPKDDKPE